jgi:hypothetical protein
MNKMRRKAIYILIKKLNAIKDGLHGDYVEEDIISELDDVYDEADCIRDDEECYMENMPENLQSSARYEIAEEACDNLYDAVDLIDEAKENVNNKDCLINCIDEAIEHLSAATR